MAIEENIGRGRMLPPLPERMRPQNLEGYVGQTHLIGQGCILRNMIDSGNLSSFILWGPPGVGKTTLSRIVAKSLGREFFTLSAVSAGVKDVRDVIEITPKSDEKSIKQMSREQRELMIKKLTIEMKQAAKLLEFEHAAELRDRISKLRGGK